jgi:SAM-dependent methyltransferase
LVAWDRVRSSHDRVAAAYATRFIDELRGKPRDRELLAAFATSVSDPVVEVGCGPGHIGAFVRDHGRCVVGIDLSEGMAKLSARRLDTAATANMRSLPLASSTAAGLIAFYSLIHVRREELGPVLHEFKRVLRPGGRALFSTQEDHGEVEVDEFLGAPVSLVASFFQLDELIAASRTAGLVIIRAERRAPYPSESETFRLYVEARSPEDAAGR